MKLIVGLGNPGRAYSDSRHNAGFQVIKALADFFDVSLKKENATFSLSAKFKVEGKDVILALPLTFMNLSGLAVAALVKKYKVALNDLLMVCDDLDLEFGRIKIRPSGSSSGQKGLESVIDYLNSKDFSRLRVGIGRPHKNIDAAEYVLSPFSKKEKEQLKGIIEEAVDCSKFWVTHGITETMNRFNKRSQHE